MKKIKLQKTLSLLAILLIGNLALQAQGVKTFPEDDEPPIGVSNWGLNELTKAADASGQYNNDNDAYWDLGYSGDWICRIFTCPEEEPPAPNPDPAPADTTSSGGGGGNNGGGTNGAPPEEEDKDDDKEEDEKSSSSGIISKYLKSAKAGQTISFKITPNEKEKVKAYMKGRAKMNYWKQEGFFYTYFNRTKENGKNQFYFYVTDQRPNIYKPVPALQYKLVMQNGTVNFIPTFVKNQKYKTNNNNRRKKNLNGQNGKNGKPGKREKNKQRR